MEPEHFSASGVCVGPVDRVGVGERSTPSAYYKFPVGVPVGLSHCGFDGDQQFYSGHGGPDRAVLVYSRDHYAFWSERFGLDLPAQAAFGENVTVDGAPDASVFIGDVFQLGTARLEVSQPRHPCYKHALRYSFPTLAIDMMRTGYTGYLLRVLEPGIVNPGDDLVRIFRNSDGISVADATRILWVEKSDIVGAKRLGAMEQLANACRDELSIRFRE